MAGTPQSLSGMRNVDNINQADIVKNVSPVVLMLQDERKSLMTYLQSLGTETVDNAKFEEFYDELVPNRGTFSGTSETGTPTQGATADGTGFTVALDLGAGANDIYVTVDDRVYFPSTGEIARVSSVPASMASVPLVRNIAGNATGNLANGALWIKIGDARAGGSRVFDGNTLQSVSVNNDDDYNFTQTFREPFGMTRREGKTKLYSGNDEKTQKTKKLMEHCEKIEHAFWYGRRLDEGNERTHTGGVMEATTSINTLANVAALTEAELDDWVRRVTRYGDRRKKVLFCSRYIAMKISQFAYTNQRIQSGKEVKHGVHVTKYLTGLGTELDIVTADALEGSPGSATLGAHDGDAVLMSMTGKKKVVFGGDDLKYAEGIQYKDMDGKANEYLSDVGYRRGDARKDSRLTITTL